MAVDELGRRRRPRGSMGFFAAGRYPVAACAYSLRARMRGESWHESGSLPNNIFTVCLRVAAFAVAWFSCVPDALADTPTGPAAALRARYVALSQQLENSTIQRGLYLESTDNSRAPRGDAYAVIDYPFATVAAAFAKPADLCESLILHLNVQYCRASIGDGGPLLSTA